MAPRRRNRIIQVRGMWHDGTVAWAYARVITRRKDGFAVAEIKTQFGTTITVNLPPGRWREI